MKLTNYSLLVIEDSDEDFEALSRIINQVSMVSLDVHRCIDGEDALNFLRLNLRIRELTQECH